MPIHPDPGSRGADPGADAFRLLVEHSPDIVCLHDSDCRTRYVSPSVHRVLGYLPDELIGMLPAALVHPDDLPGFIAALDHCRASGGRGELTLRMRARAGHHVWLETLVQAIHDDDGRFLHFASTSRDITGRRRAEEDLQRALVILRGVADGTADAVFVRHVDGTYEFTNKAARALLAVNEESGDDVLAERLGLADPGLLVATETIQLERQLTVGDTKRTFAVHATPRRSARGTVTGVVAIVSDISERARSEGESRHKQKMEAVGQLAGGIAHEFNNLLTVICGYADLLAQTQPADSSTSMFIDEIRSASRLAATLTQRLLTFSQRQVTRMAPVDLNAALATLHPILRSTVGEPIALELVLGERVPAVIADQNQLEQAVINLALNARDAMPEGGTLHVETAFIAPRDVRLVVRDTGVGIDPQIVDRIFEPFFTTKPTGKGTGLGLSTVYSIVDQAGGTVQVESQPGQGATFIITLPAAEVSPTGGTARRGGTPAHGSTVLVVEDEGRVRRMAARVLTDAGYQIIQAETGSEAIRVAEAHRSMIDLVLIDLGLPELDGHAVVTELRRRKIGGSYLFMTGAFDPAVLDAIVGAGDVVMPKPVTPAMLLDVVGGMLTDRTGNVAA